MRETPFGFEYSWADLQPIRALSVVVVAGQVIGALGGWVYPRFPDWFESMWFGSALSTFPSFVVGLAVQAHDKPGSLSANKVMVRRFALVAALMSCFALAMPFFGFGEVE
ncbi:hypothetical protein [Roseateles sp. LYH14W]|uniref:MFS transporter n=1 Tax=Pelomonas parva TaxID=3299032 RepID=A0ABW7F140_9BURK